jgi:hypothetical protein
LFVLHKCDNRACVNPNHLFLGTAKENTDDMIAKGRMVIPDRAGERNGRAKLTPEQVQAIRAASGRQVDIAAAFGVTQTTVSAIKRYAKWTHLERIAA